jgi:hypothetical protein
MNIGANIIPPIKQTYSTPASTLANNNEIMPPIVAIKATAKSLRISVLNFICSLTLSSSDNAKYTGFCNQKIGKKPYKAHKNGLIGPLKD